jgi:hypothetical protein
LRATFYLGLRQIAGLIGSIMRLLAINLRVPHHSTLSRRACGLSVQKQPRSGTGELHLIVDSTGLKLRGASEWITEKHGTSKHRSWRKVPIGIDAVIDQIVAFNLTDKDVDDASDTEPLLEANLKTSREEFSMTKDLNSKEKPISSQASFGTTKDSVKDTVENAKTI